MSDIFISYSRKDSEQALALAERLRDYGADVWIDQHGITGAEQWATEIVEGIRDCSTFIILLSPDSVQSENVLKELSLASEKRKRILPVDLLAADLPTSFEYSLAGLQRVAISDFDGILRAHKHGVARVVVKDTRKSLIVLPFEDLSPSGEDNGWFADGLAGEMIDSLGHIKSLRILDRKTSIALRSTKLRTVEIGKEFNTRYFIEGSVRKFGEQIKISVALLDIETGDYLWQESHRGEFKDIFDIQEAMANKVVEGLKLHLTKEEKTLLQERGTENTEAYEFYIKANEYFQHHTSEGFRNAIQLFNNAISLDPDYANAHLGKGNVLANFYRTYDQNATLLAEAERLVLEALRLKPDLWNAYYPLSFIFQLQGKLDEAEAAAKKYIEISPDYYQGYFALGFFYQNIGQPAKSILQLEKAVRLKPDHLGTLWNLTGACSTAKDYEKLVYWASQAIPFLERHLKFHPDDEFWRVGYALVLNHAGRSEDARNAAKALGSIKDSASLFNIGCLWKELGDSEIALRIIYKSLEAGYRNMLLVNTVLEAEIDRKGTPEYEEVKQMVEKIEAEQLTVASKEKDNG